MNNSVAVAYLSVIIHPGNFRGRMIECTGVEVFECGIARHHRVSFCLKGKGILVDGLSANVPFAEFRDGIAEFRLHFQQTDHERNDVRVVLVPHEPSQGVFATILQVDQLI